MAKATNQYTTAQDVWTVDDAFRYLTRVISKQDDLAIYELTESLLAGRLRMTAGHFVDGALKSEGIVRATFWRDLTLHVTEGKAEVRPLRAALEPGEYHYTLSARDVRMLWPAPPSVGTAAFEPRDIKKWLTDEVGRRRTANDIPTGRGALTKFSQQLANRMIEANKAGEVKHAIGARRIETVLHDIDLWPKPFRDKRTASARRRAFN
jgi:hypothetical protein